MDLGVLDARADDVGEVMMMRRLSRLAIWGLAAYGAKRLYDDYFRPANVEYSAGRAIVDRVGRASERVKGQAHDAASDVAIHARAASEEIRDTAADVLDLSQQAATDDGQLQPGP